MVGCFARETARLTTAHHLVWGVDFLEEGGRIMSKLSKSFTFMRRKGIDFFDGEREIDVVWGPHCVVGNGW